MQYQRTVILGPALFLFSSFDDWIDTAKVKFATSGVVSFDTICIDSIGRVCKCGQEFMRARDDGTFPVIVYHIDPAYVIHAAEQPHATDAESTRG